MSLERFNQLEIPEAKVYRVPDDRERRYVQREFFKAAKESLLSHFAIEEYVREQHTEIHPARPNLSRPELLHELQLAEMQPFAFVHERPVNYSRIELIFGTYSLKATTLEALEGYAEAERLIEQTTLGVVE